MHLHWAKIQLDRIERSLVHPNIVRHIRFISEVQAIVMEKVDNGSINDYLKKQTEPISNSTSILFDFQK